MKNTNTIKLIRYMDMLLLLITIVFYPLLFLAISFFLVIIFYNTTYFFAVSILILLFIGIAVFWDTKYGIGGVGFIPPLKNYLSHKETKNDKFYARLSIVFIFGIFYIFYIIYITYN